MLFMSQKYPGIVACYFPVGRDEWKQKTNPRGVELAWKGQWQSEIETATFPMSVT